MFILISKGVFILMIDKKKIESAVKDILAAIGEDTEREGLKETPMRVANMYEELFSGKNSNLEEHVKVFNEEEVKDQLILIKDIPFYSMCEHHMLPFFGQVSIAYIPSSKKVLGLSKFSRIVSSFSKRLQVQERLNSQIAEFIYKSVPCESVTVIIEAEHLCMTMRGIKSMGSKTLTSAFKGEVSKDFTNQIEIINLLAKGE